MSQRFHRIDEQLEALRLRGKTGVKGLKKILRVQALYLRRAQWSQKWSIGLDFNPKRVGLLTAISPQQTKTETKAAAKAQTRAAKTAAKAKKKFAMFGPDGKPVK